MKPRKWILRSTARGRREDAGRSTKFGVKEAARPARIIGEEICRKRKGIDISHMFVRVI
jgi:hypothetical protein